MFWRVRTFSINCLFIALFVDPKPSLRDLEWSGFQRMLTLQEVIDSFEDPVKLRVSGLQRDGSSFLVKLDELLESDMISISKSESLFNYMVQVIMSNDTDTPVQT